MTGISIFTTSSNSLLYLVPKYFYHPQIKFVATKALTAAPPAPASAFTNLICISLALAVLGISQEWNLGSFLTEFVHMACVSEVLMCYRMYQYFCCFIQCCGLSIRCALWAHGLTLWSLAGTDILGGRAS